MNELWASRALLRATPSCCLPYAEVPEKYKQVEREETKANRPSSLRVWDRSTGARPA